ncbi:MAG: hypothetical protein JSS02_10710 [Planctomycetes bacterium]|nr:hypothetical protein [Planctomycetota bacterium]
METLKTIATVAMLGTVLGFAAGCSETPPMGKPAGEKPASKSSGTDSHDHAEHAHPSAGPHGGPLIELGKEEFHAEFVHNEDAGTVTIYILDHDAKVAVSIDAKELRINLKHDGMGEQFTLIAKPQKGDANGKASRFVSNDKELSEDLDHEGAAARLVVEIAGKSFTGEIKHKHDDHDHGKHKH